MSPFRIVRGRRIIRAYALTLGEIIGLVALCSLAGALVTFGGLALATAAGWVNP